MNRTVTQPKLLRGGNTTTAIPSGYKRTEVGLIPEGWEIDDLDALVTVIDGDRGAHYPSANEFTDSGYCLFLNAGNVTKDGFKFAERAFITRKKDTLLSKGRLRRSDVVLTTRGTVGNLAYYDASVPYDHIRINSGMVILRNESSSLDTDFLYAVLRSPVVQLQMERLSFGSAQPQLTVKGISKFQIIVPPLPEQRAIARALSDVDGLIGTLDKLIAKKQAIKQAAMQQLLTGKTRLPGFTGAWGEKSLSELAVITMGQSPSSQFYNLRGDGLPLIQGNADIENHRTIERVWTTQASKRCDAGDLLLTVRAPVGAVGVATQAACLGRGVCGLKPLGSNAFLFQALIFAEPRWKILEQGSTFTSANSTQVGQFRVQAPIDLDEQEAIATVLSEMDAEIALLERRRDKTKQIKQGMMQQLLTGRVRLINPSTVETKA